MQFTGVLILRGIFRIYLSKFGKGTYCKTLDILNMHLTYPHLDKLFLYVNAMLMHDNPLIAVGRH